MGIDFFLEMGWWEFRIHIVFLWWGNLFPLSIYSSLLEVCFQYLLLDEALKSQTFAPFLQRPKGTIRNVLELVTKFERMKAKCVFLRTVWAVKRIPQHLRNINGCEGSIAQHENLTGYRAVWPLVTGSVNIKQPSSTDSFGTMTHSQLTVLTGGCGRRLAKQSRIRKICCVPLAVVISCRCNLLLLKLDLRKSNMGHVGWVRMKVRWC